MEGVEGDGDGVLAPSDTPHLPPPQGHFLSMAGLSARWSDHGSLSNPVFSMPGSCTMARRRHTRELGLYKARLPFKNAPV